MTIKQQGGVFGRNPTFNNVEVDGTLAIGGAAIPAPADTLVSSDIGSTVQAYDADTTKNDVANVFTADQRIQNGVNSAILLGKGAENVDGVVKIKSYQSGADSDQLGIEFGVHPSQYGSGPVEAAVKIDHNKNLVIVTSGSGIDFSATSGTGTSELFDDYEEGDFSPSYSASGLSVTHDTQVGKYTKVGRLVCFTIALGSDAASGTGSSQLKITGLPYTSSGQASGIVGLAYSFSSSQQDAKWIIQSGSTTIDLYDGASNTAGVLPSSVLGTGTNNNRLQIFGFYHT